MFSLIPSLQRFFGAAKPQRQPTTARRCQLLVEALEGRELPSATGVRAVLLGDALVVKGTPRADRIDVVQEGPNLTVAGVSQTFDADAIREIWILAGRGNDRVTLTVDNDVASKVFAFGGPGKDSFVGNPPASMVRFERVIPLSPLPTANPVTPDQGPGTSLHSAAGAELSPVSRTASLPASRTPTQPGFYFEKRWYPWLEWHVDGPYPSRESAEEYRQVYIHTLGADNVRELFQVGGSTAPAYRSAFDEKWGIPADFNDNGMTVPQNGFKRVVFSGWLRDQLNRKRHPLAEFANNVSNQQLLQFTKDRFTQRFPDAFRLHDWLYSRRYIDSMRAQGQEPISKKVADQILRNHIAQGGGRNDKLSANIIHLAVKKFGGSYYNTD